MSSRVVDTWSASEYNKIASFVYSTENTAPVLALLDPKPGDKIIDLGCGSGQVTLKISKVVAHLGNVVGIDSSQSMVGTIVLSTYTCSNLIDGQWGRSTRPRETGWKAPMSKISRRSTTSLYPTF